MKQPSQHLPVMPITVISGSNDDPIDRVVTAVSVILFGPGTVIDACDVMTDEEELFFELFDQSYPFSF